LYGGAIQTDYLYLLTPPAQ